MGNKLELVRFDYNLDISPSYSELVALLIEKHFITHLDEVSFNQKDKIIFITRDLEVFEDEYHSEPGINEFFNVDPNELLFDVLKRYGLKSDYQKIVYGDYLLSYNYAIFLFEDYIRIVFHEYNVSSEEYLDDDIQVSILQDDEIIHDRIEQLEQSLVDILAEFEECEE